MESTTLTEKMPKSYNEYELSDAENENEEEPSRLQKLANRKCLLFCVYVGLIVYGLVNIAFDWLWVSDMLKTEDGLVFGQPREVTIIFLIVISSIGMIAFVFEIINFSMKVFKGKPLMDEDLAQVLSLFLEEVPSVTLNLLLAQCREVPVSYYQLAKAAFQMLGSGFRAIRGICKYCQKEKHRRKGLCPWLVRTVIFVACLYCCIASCLVFTFTYVSPPEDGADFRAPGTILDKSYDDGRYFYKSGVYFSHPNFARCNNNNIPWNETRVNWMKFQSIYDVLDADDSGILTKYHYNTTDNFISVKNPDIARSDECYRVDISDPSNCMVSPYQCADIVTSQMDTMCFKFEPRERTKTLVFGDIKFRSWFCESSICGEMTIDEWGVLSEAGEVKAQLQYFQLMNSTMNDTYIFYEEDGGLLRHYQYNIELNNVTNAWVTGYDKCPMTGSYSPNEDRDIDYGECQS